MALFLLPEKMAKSQIKGRSVIKRSFGMPFLSYFPPGGRFFNQ